MLSSKLLQYIIRALEVQIQKDGERLHPGWVRNITAASTDKEVCAGHMACETRLREAVRYRDGLEALETVKELGVNRPGFTSVHHGKLLKIRSLANTSPVSASILSGETSEHLTPFGTRSDCTSQHAQLIHIYPARSSRRKWGSGGSGISSPPIVTVYVML